MKKIYMTLVMLFAITASMAQPREIKGVVHDENDKPMSGVTVYVQETGAGTITGSKGTSVSYTHLTLPTTERV